MESILNRQPSSDHTELLVEIFLEPTTIGLVQNGNNIEGAIITTGGTDNCTMMI